MTLQSRILVVIASVMILGLVIGLGVLMENARRAVHAELESSAHLTLRLLEAWVAAPGRTASRADLLQRIGALQDIRHLCIELHQAGTLLVRAECGRDTQPRAPQWFFELVASDPVRFDKAIVLDEGGAATIAVQADPVDEVDEIWRDVRDLAVLAGSGFLGASLLLFFIVRRALRPVGQIIGAMDAIAGGRYTVALPAFSLPEFRRIAAGLTDMAQQLERTRRENRALARRSLRIQEEERQFIARELHDELGQSLVAIRADAAYIARQNAVQAPESARVAGEIMSIAANVYDVVRRLMQRLRPSVLDELGLQAALGQHVQEWSARHPETQCRLQVETELALPGPKAIAVYRIVQEALTNAARHAFASRIEISLRCEDDGLVLRVQDDGRGFDPATIRPGLGLVGMRERAGFLGGDIAIEAAPGAGTRVQVRIPLKPGPAVTCRAGR